MNNHSELLTGVSLEELEALAEGLLAPAAQARLDELLASHAGGLLSSADRGVLDRLLQRVDQLTILKTRARYTLLENPSLTALSVPVGCG